MDIQLANHLLNDASQITISFITNMMSNGIKKQELITFVIHFFSRHLLTSNVWLLKSLIEYMNAIEACKPSDNHRLIMLFYDLFSLIGQCEKKNYKFTSENDSIDIFTDEIHSILFHSLERENTNLLSLQNILHDEVYALLSILYDSLIFPVSYEKSLQKCFMIIRYLLLLPPRKYLKAKSKNSMDIPDFLFWLCISYSNENDCPEMLREYITLAKDIFYCRIQKKHKVHRINILFYIVHVILKRKVKNQTIDFHSCFKNDYIHTHDTEKNQAESQENTETGHKNKIDDPTTQKIQYLFFYSYYDEHKVSEVRQEKQKKEMMSKLMRSSVKEIEIDSILANHYARDLVITKL